MSEGWFTTPVAIAVGIVGDIHNVLSAKQALDALNGRWPDVGAPKFSDHLNQTSQDFFKAVQDGLSALGISYVLNPRSRKVTA